MIIPYKHRILSLHLNGHSLINEFYIYCNIDSSFNRLESIILNGVSDYKLLLILFYLNSLPRLFSLSIQLEEDSYYNVSDICRIIFQLPSLRFNKLSLVDYDEINVLTPNPINEKFSTIEHLVIDFCCNLDEIMSILYHTPRLRHLVCKRLVEMDENGGKAVRLTLSNLIHASFTDCSVDFDLFEAFIKKICSQLQVLSLNTSCDPTYINANRWKNLIKKYMPYLCRFHFVHEIYVDGFIDIPPSHEIINQFTSTFWIERQWFLEFKDCADQHRYSIHPHR